MGKLQEKHREELPYSITISARLHFIQHFLPPSLPSTALTVELFWRESLFIHVLLDAFKIPAASPGPEAHVSSGGVPKVSVLLSSDLFGRKTGTRHDGGTSCTIPAPSDQSDPHNSTNRVTEIIVVIYTNAHTLYNEETCTHCQKLHCVFKNSICPLF